jgi:hypothetical protein
LSSDQSTNQDNLAINVKHKGQAFLNKKKIIYMYFPLFEKRNWAELTIYVKRLTVIMVIDQQLILENVQDKI